MSSSILECLEHVQWSEYLDNDLRSHNEKIIMQLKDNEYQTEEHISSIERLNSE